MKALELSEAFKFLELYSRYNMDEAFRFLEFGSCPKGLDCYVSGIGTIKEGLYEDNILGMP